MTNSDDIRRLIASPYDPEPDDERPSRPGGGWFVPLAAGVVGLVIAFAAVALTVDTSSEALPEPSGPTTSLGEDAEVVFEELGGFPEGFTPIDGQTALKPIEMFDIDGRTYISVVAMVAGSEDPAEVPMQSIADWHLETSTGTIAPYNQAVNDVAAGGLQLGFDGLATPIGSTLVLRPATAIATERVVIFDDAPMELLVEEPITVDVDGVTVVIDRLFYNDVWGHVEWHSPDGVPATVEVIVSFLGTEGIVNDTDLALRVISFDSASVFFDIEGPFDVPAWGQSGQATLDRHGPFAYDETLVESVLVEVVISVAEVSDDVIEIPLESLIAER